MYRQKGQDQVPGYSRMFLLLIVAGSLLSGCVSMQKVPGKTSVTGNPEQDENPVRGSRTDLTLAEGSSLVVETVLLDPVIRPLSTLKALSGLIVKSVIGAIERTFISPMRFSNLQQQPIPGISNEPPMDLVAWELDLDDLTETRTVRGSVEFLIDGEEYFSRLISAIDNAEERIDIRTYIFDNDDVGVLVADHLRRKADQVDIKILVDGLGDLVAGNVDSRTLPEDFTAPASIEDYLENESMIKMRNQSNPWFTGDHAKITLIDRTTAFVGGMNIGREYRYDWHDLMMEIKGPMVDQLQFEFDKAWDRSSWLGDAAWIVRSIAGAEQLNDDEANYYPLRMLVTNTYDSQIYRAQVEAIRRARNYIYIENAYFTDDKILYELARARRRGVDVRVIVSSVVDNGFIELSDKITINKMLQSGIRVYAYPGMTHVKAAVFDGWACLGSANLDKLSLEINQEVNIATSNPQVVQRLLDLMFLKDFTAATEIHEEFQVNIANHFAEFLADEIL